MSPGGDVAVVRGRLERALGQRATAWVRPDTGLSAAVRASVTLADGSHVFVKGATDDQTESWLRTEYLALRHVPGRFVPALVAWLDEPGTHPVLVVEDLHQAHWPASHQGVDWRNGDVDRVLAAVADLSRLAAPAVFEPTPQRHVTWPAIAWEGPDQAAFLELGLCTAAWFAEAVPALVDAEARLKDSGDRMVHGDLRSDNICIEGERVVFVDWSHASRGHAEHDLALLLATLHLEGGPAPFDVMPGAGAWASAGCATLARRLVEERELLPTWLADVFVRLLGINLSWAASCLGLPQPDGTHWQSI